MLFVRSGNSVPAIAAALLFRLSRTFSRMSGVRVA